MSWLALIFIFGVAQCYDTSKKSPPRIFVYEIGARNFSLNNGAIIYGSYIQLQFHAHCIDGVQFDQNKDLDLQSLKILYRCSDEQKWTPLEYSNFSRNLLLHEQIKTDELLVLSTTQNLANYYIQLLSCNEKITWSPQNCNGAGQHSINPWMFLSHRVRHRGEMKKRNSALKKLRKKRQASADLLQQLRTQRIVSLNSNTRFVSNQNPIEINADLFVPAGITLQIEDGVELRFAAGRKLTVQGTLVASGTIANPIMMKPSSTSARWNGLRLETPHNAYDVRLAKSQYGSDGYVEAYSGTDWRPICNTNWDLQDANVVCRKLGFSGALPSISNLTVPASLGAYWLTNAQCLGSENSLSECNVAVFRSAEICDGPASVSCAGTRATVPKNPSRLNNVNVSETEEGIVIVGQVPDMEMVTTQNSAGYGIRMDANFLDRPDDPQLHGISVVNCRLTGLL